MTWVNNYKEFKVSIFSKSPFYADFKIVLYFIHGSNTGSDICETVEGLEKINLTCLEKSTTFSMVKIKLFSMSCLKIIQNSLYYIILYYSVRSGKRFE